MARRMAAMRAFICYMIVLLFGLIFYYLKTAPPLILLISILGLSPLLLTLFKKSNDALAPENLLPFTFMLYAIGPLYVSSNFRPDVIIQYLFIQLLGLIAMRFGLNVANWRVHDFKVSLAIDFRRQSTRFLLLLTGLGLLLLSSISLATYFYSFGGLIGFIQTGYGGQFYLEVQQSMVIGSGFEWGLLGSILLIFYGLKYRSKPCLFVGGFIFIFLATIILITGRRHQIIYPLLFGLALWHYAYKKIPNPVVIVGLLAGITFAQYYALARYFLPKGLIYALVQVWPAVKNNPSLFLPFAANEFRMPAASLLEVLQYGGPGLLWGSSYISSLGSPIPFVARLFSQIGFDPNRWRLETYHPDLWAAGGGLGFSPVTEGYINFGFIGVIFHLFLYGYIIGRIYAGLFRRPSLSGLLLFAGSLPVFMLDGMRVHSTSFVYAWMRTYLMPWFIFWALKICLPKRAQISSQHTGMIAERTKDIRGVS